jgi:hypothetical protein
VDAEVKVLRVSLVWSDIFIGQGGVADRVYMRLEMLDGPNKSYTKEIRQEAVRLHD